ncbi:MAG: mannose-1-phosphate guanylyltransferase [Firmicutes bacterium HGW-Firmicutes-17]|jgi:mannose-1-phosphate guanylyltransferase|nr:MAG: mannose-1-phosphate guanylyltransferase [Firmicutes bacterium HGW-Firmicutes-17]
MNKKKPLIALIMAGGKGERFWPKSRENLPKQFISLVGERSMLQQTVARINPFLPFERIFVITGKRYLALVADQLPELSIENIVLEPIGMDTAPCIGLGVSKIKKTFENCNIVILPADHVIENVENFLQTIRLGEEFLNNEHEGILTIGINPDRPETGYGYIKIDDRPLGNEIFRVRKFVEKPDLNLAEAYINEGNYFWNSGIFITDANYILEQIDKFLPELGAVLKKIDSAMGTLQEESVIAEQYRNSPRISIDYGVMQREEKIYMIKSSFRWDDVGNWNAVGEYLKNENSNQILGEALLSDSYNNIVFNEGKAVIVGLGIDDLVVVNTADAILIARKDRVQEIKKIIELLKLEHEELL